MFTTVPFRNLSPDRDKNIFHFKAEARFDDYVSPVGTSPRHQSSTRSKKDKFKATPDTLALKQELESKIEINKESYKPHTLRVKRWKNREFGEPKNEDLMNLEGLSSLVLTNFKIHTF